MSDVAVIMRSRNSDWVIHQALASLAAQRFRDYELVVVVAGSTDRTLAMVQAHRHRLITISGERYQPGPVLTAAIAETGAARLVFWHSDAVAMHDRVLEQLVGALDGADAAFVRQLPRPEAHGWVRRDYAASFPASGEPPPWITLSLVCSAMRRPELAIRTLSRAARSAIRALPGRAVLPMMSRKRAWGHCRLCKD